MGVLEEGFIRNHIFHFLITKWRECAMFLLNMLKDGELLFKVCSSCIKDSNMEGFRICLGKIKDPSLSHPFKNTLIRHTGRVRNVEMMGMLWGVKSVRFAPYLGYETMRQCELETERWFSVYSTLQKKGVPMDVLMYLKPFITWCVKYPEGFWSIKRVNKEWECRVLKWGMKEIDTPLHDLPLDPF